MQVKSSQAYRDKHKSVILEFASFNKLMFFFGIISTIATSFIVLGFGWSVRKIVNAISVSEKTQINSGMLSFFWIAIFMCVFSFLRSFLMNLLTEQFCNHKKSEIFAKILNAKMKTIHTTGSERLISILSTNMTQIKAAFGTSFPFFIRSSFTLIGSLCLLIYISPILTLYTIGTILIMLSPAFVLKKSLKNAKKKAENATKELESFRFDGIMNVRLIKSFCGENIELFLHNHLIENLIKYEKKRLAIRSIFISMCVLAVVIGILVSINFGVIQIQNGIMTSGDLTAFMLYSVMVALGLSGAGEHGVEFFQSRSVWAKIRAIESSLINENVPFGKNVNESIDEISIHSFSFKHSEKEEILIPNCKIKKGQIGILKGKSGSGKSSFFDILVKYNEIENGLIFFNENDINELSPSSIRTKISYFSQNSVVMEKTLYENMSYSQHISQYSVITMLEKLNLSHLISRMNDKIANFSLSGGEKTRLGIGMCLLKDANLFIFDEPTNGLDFKNIQSCLDLIFEKTKDKILIIASHDETLINKLNKDNIVEIDVCKK